MDFMNNVWSKTGLRKGSQSAAGETSESETTATDKTTTDEVNPEEVKDATTRKESATTGKIGFMSNFIKSTFKGGNNQSDSPADSSEDRKTSVTSDHSNREGESLSPKGFGEKVSNIFKNPFKSDSRKGSTSSTGAADDTNKGNEEGQVTEGDEAVTQKAMDSAKHFGSFLSSVAMKAGQTVTATAKHVKQTVVSNSLLSDFTKEQADFVREHGGSMDASDPPWIGVDNEEEVKKEIISLSQDKRNFVRNPPAGVEFDFDLQTSLPVALGILREDPNLAKMRYEIVPKLVNEETFWRNYFYRVSLLKQSTAANSLGGACKRNGSTSSSEAEGPDEVSPSTEQPEFLKQQDSFRQDSVTSSGIRRLDSKTEDKRWEEEITKDLQEFEVVGEAGSEDVCDEDLEKDLAALST